MKLIPTSQMNVPKLGLFTNEWGESGKAIFS